MSLNIEKLCSLALPGDAILTGTHRMFGIGALIQSGQACQTRTGERSRWKHIRRYVDSVTVWESTIDRNPYWPPAGKKLEMRVQYNDMEDVSGDKHEYGVLIRYKLLTDLQRQLLLNEMERIEKLAAARDPRYRYDITGLFGSLLSYWLLKSESNPLSGYGLYCSAASQDVDLIVLGRDYDACAATTKNTSPEMLWQFYLGHPKMFEIIEL